MSFEVGRRSPVARVNAGREASNLAVDVANTTRRGSNSSFHRPQLLALDPVEHVNLTLPLEALDVSRFERAAGVGQHVPGHFDPIRSQCLHPHAFRMKSSIAVVSASVDAQNDLSAILQMNGENSVLANLDGL